MRLASLRKKVFIKKVLAIDTRKNSSRNNRVSRDIEDIIYQILLKVIRTSVSLETTALITFSRNAAVH